MTGTSMRWERLRHTSNVEGQAISRAKLSCGHAPKGDPPLSNPRRWFCCGKWRKQRT